MFGHPQPQLEMLSKIYGPFMAALRATKKWEGGGGDVFGVRTQNAVKWMPLWHRLHWIPAVLLVSGWVYPQHREEQGRKKWAGGPQPPPRLQGDVHSSQAMDCIYLSHGSLNRMVIATDR